MLLSSRNLGALFALSLFGYGMSVSAVDASDAQLEHNKPHIWASVGWSQLNLPDFAFTLRHQDRNEQGDFTPLQFLGRQVDDDGKSDEGHRLDFGFNGLVINRGGDPVIYVGAKGFYASYSSKSATGCDERATQLGNSPDLPGSTCTFIPLTQEADIPGTYQIGASELTSGKVRRDVTNWGASIEASFNDREKQPIALKFGAGYKSIDQDISYQVTGAHWGTTNTVGNATYDEDLNTGYWGGYIGVEGEVPLGSGISLGLDGNAGLYYARTNYTGKYSYDLFQSNSTELDLTDNDVSFIASMKVELKKKFRHFNLSAFALGEYYSYAPKVIYKSNDLSNGGGAYGDADKTHLGSDDAWGVTAGVRASVPLN